MISALPDLKLLPLSDDHDFMVIACDGIWQVLISCFYYFSEILCILSPSTPSYFKQF